MDRCCRPCKSGPGQFSAIASPFNFTESNEHTLKQLFKKVNELK